MYCKYTFYAHCNGVETFCDTCNMEINICPGCINYYEYISSNLCACQISYNLYIHIKPSLQHSHILCLQCQDLIKWKCTQCNQIYCINCATKHTFGAGITKCDVCDDNWVCIKCFTVNLYT